MTVSSIMVKFFELLNLCFANFWISIWCGFF